MCCLIFCFFSWCRLPSLISNPYEMWINLRYLDVNIENSQIGGLQPLVSYWSPTVFMPFWQKFVHVKPDRLCTKIPKHIPFILLTYSPRNLTLRTFQWIFLLVHPNSRGQHKFKVRSLIKSCRIWKLATWYMFMENISRSTHMDSEAKEKVAFSTSCLDSIVQLILLRLETG